MVDIGLSSESDPPGGAISDLCSMVATGGTTGVSKVSRRDWDGYARMADLGPTPVRRQLIVTPLAYISQIIADGVDRG
jgi:fatty-acyl-CoA synthase